MDYRYGKKPKRKPPAKVSEDKVRACAGMYLIDASKLLGLSCKTLASKERKWNINFLRKPIARPPIPMPDGFSEQAKNAQIADLMALHKVSRSVISRWRKEAGLLVSPTVEPTREAMHASLRMSAAEGIQGYRFCQV